MSYGLLWLHCQERRTFVIGVFPDFSPVRQLIYDVR